MNTTTKDREAFITTMHGGAGWFAVHIWWNPDGFWEPYQTGVGRYATEAEAEIEGRAWSASDEIRFLAPEETPA